MTKLTLAILLLTAATAQAEKNKLPSGLRCESVKQSSVLDLPAFCQKPLDKRRLVDYGYQLDMLETCGEADLAKSLKSALQAKVYREDVRGCADIAENLIRGLKQN